ncbi:MAG: ribonuclease P protein component [Candidatus Omnitrophota bacterium]
MEPKKRLGPGQRIRRQATFKRLVEQGQFVRGELCYLWVEKKECREKPDPREKPMVGIVVSRKTDPTAVGRNRWKRRVREIFREHQSQLHPWAKCLVKVRHTQKKPSFLDVEEELVKLFKKAGVWA